MSRLDNRDSQPPMWDADTLRDPHSRPDKAARVESMFDAIAPTYERVNTVASLGRDAVWRRRAVAAADVRLGDVVLDICCGTGDMLRGLAAVTPAPRLVLGLDFSAAMLARATASGLPDNARLLRADALRLPLADESIDAITCAFGVRNFRDLPAGLGEMYRVARPGARVVILEFAPPENALLRWVYQAYCDHVLPRVAAAISRDNSGAYRYLPRSIRTFETASGMQRRLEAAGFIDVRLRRMNLGGVVLCRCAKAAE